MITGYALQFFHNNTDTFITQTESVAKVEEAYNNTVKTLSPLHENLTIRVYRMEFSDATKATMDEEVTAMAERHFKDDGVRMVAAHVKVDGVLLADVDAIIPSLLFT